jgi:anti-sigma B factor antagonist
MTTLDRTPSVANVSEAPAESRLRSGAVHKLGTYATICLVVRGPAPVTVFVTGDIDLACADQLAAVLHMTLDAYPQGIDLDLASVRFCDCRGLRALLAAQAFARRRGRPFALGPYSPIVARLLELTGTRSVLTNPD